MCRLCCTGVLAVVTSLAAAAAVLELQLRVGAGTGVGALLQYHRRPTGVSVEQQQGLVVALNTARHHVLPLGADLEVQQGNTHAHTYVYTTIAHKGKLNPYLEYNTSHIQQKVKHTWCSCVSFSAILALFP